MDARACPKCNSMMDEGRISWSGDSSSGYVSNKQKGMLRRVTNITQACACPNCGYVEMYLNPQELKERIG